MRASVVRGVFLTFLTGFVFLGGSMLLLTGCNGEGADDWVVIHANRMPGGGGGPTTECELVTGIEITSLPGCLLIEEGDKIGFANFYNECQVIDDENVNVGKAIVVKFNSPVFGEDRITLQYQEKKVLRVQQTPGSSFQVNFEFVDSPGDLGGPVMVPVRPPEDDD